MRSTRQIRQLASRPVDQRDRPEVNPEDEDSERNTRRWPLASERYLPGQTHVIFPGAQAVDLLRAIGDDDTGLAMTVTIQAIEEAIGATAVPDLVAIVTWGNGGTSHRAEIDVGTGVVFTLHASSVQVGVQNRDPPPVPVVQEKLPFSVSGSIDYLPRATARPVTRTIETAAIAPAGAVIVSLPAFAHVLHVLSDVAAGTSTVEFLGATGVVVLASAAIVAPSDPLVIPNRARRVRITNTAAVAQTYQLVSDLSF